MEGVKMWLSSQAEEFFDTSIHHLFPDTIVSILVVNMLNSSFKFVGTFHKQSFFFNCLPC
jgi:hypothetical protein